MTTLVDHVATRLNANVPALKDRVEYIADLAALVTEGAMPQREVAAYVVPLGFDDKGGGSSSAGIHTQNLGDAVGVILCVKALGDAKAKRAVPAIDNLTTDVVNAIAGWAPEEVSGVFNVTRGRLVSVTKGLVIFQIDFSLTRQLRIT